MADLIIVVEYYVLTILRLSSFGGETIYEFAGFLAPRLELPPPG